MIFYPLVALNVPMAIFALMKTLKSNGSIRRRFLVVFLFCLTMMAAVTMQIVWTPYPYYALGCLLGTCFLHIFLVEDERAEMRKAAIEHEQTVKHMAEIENALERARAAEKARSMFFSIVSHDIRTPLNAIIGYSELLRHGLDGQAERDEALDSICRGLVEVMGGKFVVESELGKGSKFTVRLPGVEAYGSKGTVQTAAQNPAVGLKNLPKHVLVVDDSPINRSVLAALLEHIGVNSIGEAGDGEEALSALESSVKSGSPYDFVFSDLWMPKMNGIELIERLRADPRFESLPVFALTADIESHHDERTKLFNGILLKPITCANFVKVFDCR